MLGVGAGSWTQPAAGQLPPPRVATVSPNTDLTLQVVQVSWSGFLKTKLLGTHRVAILQCISPADSFDDCYLQSRASGSPPGNEIGLVTPTPVYGRTADDGTGTTLFEVRPARYLPELGCGVEHECELVVLDRDEVPTGNYDTAPLPAGRAVVPLDFADVPASCASGTPDVRVIGEESARHALYEWAVDTCVGDEQLLVDYTQTSGPRGRDTFLSGGTDIGVTSRPVPTADIAGARPFAYAPLDASATVVVFRIFDKTSGRPVDELNLSPRLVARLISSSANYNSVGPGGGAYGGTENIFDDPELRTLNPGAIDWPDFGAFTPFVRSEQHDDAYLLTTWIANDTDARAYLSGQDRCGRPLNPFWGPTDTVPAAIDTYPIDRLENRSANSDGAGFKPVQGTEASIRRLFNGIVNQGARDFVTGIVSDVVENWEEGSRAFIGVTDLGTALAYQLPIASLVPARTGTTPTITSCAPVPGSDFSQTAVRTADGLATPVPLTDATLGAAYDLLLPDPGDGPEAAFAAATSTPGAYPLARVDYGLVPTSGLAPEAIDHIATFLDYVAGEGQQNLPFGLPELPSTFVAQTATAAAAVRAQTAERPNPPPEPPPLTLPLAPGVASVATSSGGAGGSGSVSRSAAAAPGPSSAVAVPGATASSGSAQATPVVFASVEPSGGSLAMILPITLVLAVVAALLGAVLFALPVPRPGTPPALAIDPEPPTTGSPAATG